MILRMLSFPKRQLCSALLTGLLLYCATARMVFHPPQPPWYKKTDPHIIQIGPLQALWLTQTSAKATILYNHGHATDIGYDDYYIRELHDMGYNILAYDYQGYGHSSGFATEQHFYADSEDAFAYLTTTLGIPEKQIILYGNGIGSTVAIRLAAKHDVAGLIAIAPFLSSNRTITQWRVLPWDFFDATRWITQVKAPTLFLQKTHNSYGPLWQTRALFAALRSPKVLYISPYADTMVGNQKNKSTVNNLVQQTLDRFASTLAPRR